MLKVFTAKHTFRRIICCDFPMCQPPLSFCCQAIKCHTLLCRIISRNSLKAVIFNSNASYLMVLLWAFVLVSWGRRLLVADYSVTVSHCFEIYVFCSGVMTPPSYILVVCGLFETKPLYEVQRLFMIVINRLIYHLFWPNTIHVYSRWFQLK